MFGCMPQVLLHKMLIAISWMEDVFGGPVHQNAFGVTLLYCADSMQGSWERPGIDKGFNGCAWCQGKKKLVVLAVTECALDGRIAGLPDLFMDGDGGEVQRRLRTGWNQLREILGHAVAQVDHGGNDPLAGEPLPLFQPGLEMKVSA